MFELELSWVGEFTVHQRVPEKVNVCLCGKSFKISFFSRFRLVTLTKRAWLNSITDAEGVQGHVLPVFRIFPGLLKLTFRFSFHI